MLWVLQQRDPRFAGSVDSRTSRLFVIWFVLCIFLTVSGTMAVANIAHGAGAVMGALMGWAISRGGLPRTGSIAAMVIISVLSLAGSTIWWPQLNQTEYAQAEVERLGVEALFKRENQRAVELLEMSTHMKAAPARAWYNLGIAYQRMGQHKQALAAYEQAARLPSADNAMRKAATEMKEYISRGP
jgi:cytochrome c-type biogenesis protein CcmH/NrfG